MKSVIIKSLKTKGLAKSVMITLFILLLFTVSDHSQNGNFPPTGLPTGCTSTTGSIACSGSVSTGSSAPTVTPGTAGVDVETEGTVPTAMIANSDGIYSNSTNHCPDWVNSNGSAVITDYGCLAAVGATQTLTGTNTLTKPVVSGGGTPTIAGTGACATVTTQVGGKFAGSFKCTGVTGASTITITLGITAPNGYTCVGSDMTTVADVLIQTGYAPTTCTFSTASTAANDVLTFSAVAF